MNTTSKDYVFINFWKLWKKILTKLTAHLFPFSALCVDVHVPSSLLSLQATSNLPLPFLSLVKLTPSCSFALFVFLSFFTSHSMSSINKIFYLLLYFSLTFSFFFFLRLRLSFSVCLSVRVFVLSARAWELGERQITAVARCVIQLFPQSLCGACITSDEHQRREHFH